MALPSPPEAPTSTSPEVPTENRRDQYQRCRQKTKPEDANFPKDLENTVPAKDVKAKKAKKPKDKAEEEQEVEAEEAWTSGDGEGVG